LKEKNVIIVSSTANSKVKALRHALKEGKPSAMGAVWIEGLKLAREAVSAGLRVEEAWVAVEKMERGPLRQLAKELEARDAPLMYVTEQVFQSLSELDSPQGILLSVRRPAFNREDILSKESFLLVACEIQDPGNLGTVLRSAEAFGVNAVLVCPGSACPFSPKVIRSSSGAVLRLPVFEDQELTEIMDRVKSKGYRLLAAAGGKHPDFRAIDFTGKLALWVGNEGHGLPASVLEWVDQKIAVPLAPPVDSLNVAMATSIILCEAARQRGLQPGIPAGIRP
jgi:TrmH family RNA methyltransferase